MRRIIYILMIFPILVYSQEKISFRQAVDIAIKNNAFINIAKNNTVIANNNQSYGNAGFYPKIDLNGQIYANTNANPDNFATAYVGLNWILFDGLKNINSYDKFGENKILNQIKYSIQVENTASSIFDIYYNIFKQKEIIRTYSESVELSKERFRIAKEKLILGSISKMQLNQIELYLNADLSSLKNEEIKLQNLNYSFNQLLEINIEQKFDIEDSIIFKEDYKYQDLKELAFQKNKEILLDESFIKLAEFDTEISKSKFYPNLNLFSNYMYNNSSYNNITNNYTNLYYGLNLQFNLFNGMSNEIEWQNLKINEENNKLIYQNTKNRIESELIKSFNNYSKNLELMNLENSNVKLAFETLSIAKEQFDHGAISNLEYREVQMSYISAKYRYINSLFNVKISEKDLLLACGIFWTN